MSKRPFIDSSGLVGSRRSLLNTHHKTTAKNVKYKIENNILYMKYPGHETVRIDLKDAKELAQWILAH